MTTNNNTTYRSACGRFAFEDGPYGGLFVHFDEHGTATCTVQVYTGERPEIEDNTLVGVTLNVTRGYTWASMLARARQLLPSITGHGTEDVYEEGVRSFVVDTDTNSVHLTDSKGTRWGASAHTSPEGDYVTFLLPQPQPTQCWSAHWVRNDEGTLEIQTWPYWPDAEEPDRRDPVLAWFLTGNTGAGGAGPYFTSPVKAEAVAQAEAWGRENLA